MLPLGYSFSKNALSEQNSSLPMWQSAPARAVAEEAGLRPKQLVSTGFILGLSSPPFADSSVWLPLLVASPVV